MSTRIPGARSAARKSSPAMRKEPRQARSRAMVEAILTAGARVLGARGMDGFTTNEVAEVAGVSIGSLYQYFPDKLSLIDAIRRRHLDDVLAVLHRSGEGDKSPAELITDLVDGMIAVHRLQPSLHRVLLDEAPQYDGARSVHSIFETEYRARYEAIIAAFRKRGDRRSMTVMAQVLSSAVEGVIHNAARRDMLAAPELRQELAHLIYAYLSRNTESAGLS